jgi:branched-chain amino acid transport system permease protein
VAEEIDKRGLKRTGQDGVLPRSLAGGDLKIFLQIIIYGFINSTILLLMASGFALVYSISRVANFAHGALYVVAAYFTWMLLTNLGFNYFLAILSGVIIVTFLGAVMYRYLLIRVRGMPLSEIIASFAIGLGILELLRSVGLKALAYNLPLYIDGRISIAGITVDLHRIMIVLIGSALVALLWFFIHYTRVGLSLRGIAQDEGMAMLLGIDSDRAALIALSLGSALAGIAAVILVPLGTIAVDVGYEVLVYAISICILGGLGNWGGAVLGALVVGFAQTTTSTLFGSQWQMVVALAAILLILILKPSGLSGRQKELEERV